MKPESLAPCREADPVAEPLEGPATVKVEADFARLRESDPAPLAAEPT